MHALLLVGTVPMVDGVADFSAALTDFLPAGEGH